MDNANMDHANDQDHVKIKEEKKVDEENTNTTGKIYVKPLIRIKKDPSLKSTSDDVQRAIKGLREIPDEELKEFLDDEDFMEGLDVVDAWERDEDKNRENEQDTTESTKQGKNQLSREHHRPEAKESHKRKKSKREEKKREEIRRDPLKSTKDIERDKMRTKRDTESKLLAEKEKAIKHLLDSDNVVPPGTETEAIQSIAEEQNRERAQREAQRASNKEHRRSKSSERYGRLSLSRRRTPDRSRLSPHRRKSPFASPDRRRSPFKTSVERHRSPYRHSPSRRKNSPRSYDRRSPVLSPDRRRSPRRLSGERRSSADRRWSAERRRSRRADWTHERRRSRSHDRRSRSTERPRRRSSRSPVSRRYSPRRRSRTRSRSPEKRTRKRSPFINELARQLRNEAMSTGANTTGYVPPATMEGIAPLLNPTYQQDAEPRPPTQPPPPQPPPPPSVAPPYTHQPLPPPPPPTPSSSSAMLPPMPSGPPFMNFEPMPTAVPLMNFEPMPLAPTLTPTSYSSGPVIYNQPNAAAIQVPPVMCSPLLPVPPTPQPVPPPVMDNAHISYNPSYTLPFQQSSIRQFEPPNKPSNHPTTPSTSSQSYTEHGPAASYNEAYSPPQERVKTPEPPIISKPKHFEKTSLSSLLEASVSAKDSSNIPVLYPGFKPEIMRHCEQALYQLPMEDPRLKMKGRFFYDRSEENTFPKDVSEDHTSNSILLQKSKTKIFWKENNAEQPIVVPKATTQMHQKICQTDEVETESKGVQARVTTADFGSQVYADDLEHVKEEKRPIMDRLDWSARDTYEYGTKFREVEDLRWSLSNSSQRRTWNRQTSPSRRSEQEHHSDSIDHESRNSRLDSPIRSRDDFSAHSNVGDHYSHDRYSPDYHRRSMERDEFHERRSDHSRGESPMELEESDDELMTGHTFQRGSDWHGRGKGLRGKNHNSRGKHVGGRPYRSRGNFRGKF